MSADVQYRRKVIPYSISILWRATDGGAADLAKDHPLFLQQRAITALHDHFRSAPEQGILGFLLGNLYECPETHTRYAVIDLVMRLSAQIYADKTTLVVSRVWEKMQEEVTKSGGRLLGWYHSHPPTGIELPAGDVETHQQYFSDPWQVALVLGQDEHGTTAGFFRPTRDTAHSPPPAVLPFYEILDPRAVTPDGKKKSSVRWKNYRPHKPPVVGKPQAAGAAAPPAAAMTGVILPAATTAMPKMQPPAAPAPLPAPRIEAPPPPPPPEAAIFARAEPGSAAPERSRQSSFSTPAPARPRRSAPKRFSLGEPPSGRGSTGRGGGGAVVAVVVVIVLAGAAAGYWFVGRPWLAARSARAAAQVADSTRPDRPASEPEAPAAGIPPTVVAESVVQAVVPPAITAPLSPPPAVTTRPGPPSVTARLDQLSDTLARLARNYQDRARLFDARQLDCAGLSRGLVDVESVWISYNAERKALTVPLDADRAARDQTLYSVVDLVESHFDRSQCTRP